MIPAKIGLDRDVPPIRNSLYLTLPSGKVWVSPTSMPVVGSPTADTSGTTRPPCGLYRLAKEVGTTPCWYQGSANTRLVPPPPPYQKSPGGSGVQAAPSSEDSPVLQPVSNTRWFAEFTASDVPPTAVTSVLLAGASTVGVPTRSEPS